VAVVGAQSQIGRFLLPRLRAEGLICSAIGRTAAADGPPVHVFDAARGGFTPPLAGADAIISLAPLPEIERVLEMARCLGAWRVIAFGSTGRFTKIDSTSPLEQDFVAQQCAAERRLTELAREAGIVWTLIRPTLIYGAGMDQTVAFIAAILRRVGAFPVVAGAHGLRQPVHADDLAAACVAALPCAAAFDQAYNLGGGERLPYPEMVRRIAASLGRRVWICPVPAVLFRGAVEVARRLPRYRFMRQEMVERMFVDLTVDHSAAERDFGYRPRAFTPGNVSPGSR
jgi:nucleoside-diphosphate-sugar epimerase